jgi:hypothetical protein
MQVPSEYRFVFLFVLKNKNLRLGATDLVPQNNHRVVDDPVAGAVICTTMVIEEPGRLTTQLEECLREDVSVCPLKRVHQHPCRHRKGQDNT